MEGRRKEAEKERENEVQREEREREEGGREKTTHRVRVRVHEAPKQARRDAALLALSERLRKLKARLDAGAAERVREARAGRAQDVVAEADRRLRDDLGGRQGHAGLRLGGVGGPLGERVELELREQSAGVGLRNRGGGGLSFYFCYFL